MARVRGWLGWGLLVACACRPSAAGDEAWLAEGPGARVEGTAEQARVLRTVLEPTASPPAGRVEVDYPLDGSVFPPEFLPPRFRWQDDTPGVDAWAVLVEGTGGRLLALTRCPPPPPEEVDLDAVGVNNEVYKPTPRQASARTWSPPAALWTLVKERSVASPARVKVVGFRRADPGRPLSRGAVTLSTSADPVGAPIFYRDVPLMPSRTREGVIKPLAQDATHLITWRLRDVSQERSRVVLKGMETCANCHSFSRDGKTLGMDIDGPDGDKGAYALAPVLPRVEIGPEHILTWNSFPGRPVGHKTIGFMSQVSPDGRHVVSTVNEEVFVANFPQFQFLQVFYPTRGILAFHARETGRMAALPGADSTDHVQCSPAWSPDGKEVIFSRAPASDGYIKGRDLPTHANDPREPPVRYDLYRVPFNDGRGGVAVPVEGASGNGMSNSFPKVSPDGKWIVFVKARNGLLMRPDGELWMVPYAGGQARRMRCNTARMNSWHSFSPNGRWMVFSSKSETPYTQLFLTHVDPEGNDSPAILLPHSTAANRAANIPEFVNVPPGGLEHITVRSNADREVLAQATALTAKRRYDEAMTVLRQGLAANPGNWEAHAVLGDIHREHGRLAEARAAYEAGLKLDPDNPTMRVHLGAVAVSLGDRAAALHNLKEAMRLGPHDVVAQVNMAALLNSAHGGDLSFLAGMPLTSLDLRGSRSSSLAPLQGMPLRQLFLEGSPVTDLTPLRGQPLQTLGLGGTRVVDLGPLRGMPLKALDVRGTPVADLSPLQGAPLEKLNVDQTGVADLGPLKGMPLYDLSLAQTRVSSVAPLSGSATLQGLNLGQTGVTELGPLAGLRLRNLRLTGTPVTSVAPLRGMPLLELFLHGTRVADLGPLQGAPLTVLGAADTPVADLSPLRGMALATLSLGGTRVKDLSPLQGMPLDSLSLEDTPVSDLSPLQGMPLTELSLSNTPVKDLAPLRGMPLKRLYVEGTPVTDVTPLEGMKLEELFWTPGRVSDVGVIRRMASLRRVGIRSGVAPVDPDTFWRLHDANKLPPPP
jgi:Leucine-rich repeat (LRR) protein